MSGGVDSSVAAALLVERGFAVEGVTFRTWSDVQDGAVADAQKVCRYLGITHHVLDLRDIFEVKVIDPFCREYLAGCTPNPCVVCNREIKFGVLLAWARERGFELVATGHYARVRWDPLRRRYLLLRAVDRDKDQSYVLYRLTQAQLARCLFPLGDVTKRQVRRLASTLELPVATKRESQEVCFIPEGGYRSFLAERHPEACRPGPILDSSGRVLGTHEGFPFYTVGQRRGLRIASRQRLYVLRLEPERNAVVVGSREELGVRGLRADQPNWIPFEHPPARLELEARIRYRARPAEGLLVLNEGGFQFFFRREQLGVTPGQSVVLYSGSLVVGGGRIAAALT